MLGTRVLFRVDRRMVDSAIDTYVDVTVVEWYGGWHGW